MSLVVDAGPLLTQADAQDDRSGIVTEILRDEPGELIVSAFVAAEADYLIAGRLGTRSELLFLDDLASGTFAVMALSREELALARDVARKYPDLGLGLADASIVVLAARFGIERILTFDERHLRAIEPLQGGHFTILPSDAPADA